MTEFDEPVVQVPEPTTEVRPVHERRVPVVWVTEVAAMSTSIVCVALGSDLLGRQSPSAEQAPPSATLALNGHFPAVQVPAAPFRNEPQKRVTGSDSKLEGSPLQQVWVASQVAPDATTEIGRAHV